MENVRSSAKERRLRQKRSDARIRLRLAADAALLSEHHASDIPQPAAHLPMRGSRVIELLEQLVAQKGALFSVIASMNGWQAGVFHGGANDTSGKMFSCNSETIVVNDDLSGHTTAPAVGMDVPARVMFPIRFLWLLPSLKFVGMRWMQAPWRWVRVQKTIVGRRIWGMGLCRQMAQYPISSSWRLTITISFAATFPTNRYLMCWVCRLGSEGRSSAQLSFSS